MTACEDEICVDLQSYRKLVKNFMEMRRYRTALFWAEKVSVLSGFDSRDIFWQAQCMFLLKEYHRAAHLIRSRDLDKTNVQCLYLVAECLFEAKEYQEALDLLNSVDFEELAEQRAFHDDCSRDEILSSIYFIKGKILEAMDNRNLAMDSYVQALQKSVYCCEALDALVQHDMLMAWEEKELLQRMPIDQQCAEGDREIVRFLYESKLKKYYESIVPTSATAVDQTPVSSTLSSSLVHEFTQKLKNSRNLEVDPSKTKCFTPVASNVATSASKFLNDLRNTPSYSIHTSLSKCIRSAETASTTSKAKSECNVPLSVDTCLSRLAASVDIMAARAEKLFYNSEYKKALRIIDEILKRDVYHSRSLTVKIECLVELKETTSLFNLAHKLIDLYPDEAIAWYAVGCYYDLIGKSDQARRYLSKATTLDRLFGPAWLAYGHSFAKENEHDQAMAAYFKATQLRRGCHLPLLYIGVECGLTKNLEMAEKFFYQAMSIAPLDVFVLFELGVIKFEYELYESAEEVFKTTLDMVTTIAKNNGESISPRWEPLLNNLGHCCRKNKKYEEALEYHRQALILKPLSASTYTAIGFVQALMGNLEEAIESFHKSLAIKRDDVVSSTILKTVIEDLVESGDYPVNLDYIEGVSKEESSGIPKAERNVKSKLYAKLNFDDESNVSLGSDTIDISDNMEM